MSSSLSDTRTGPEGPITPSAPSGDDVTLRPDADTSIAEPRTATTSWRGRFIGRFVLLERLGRGGMGVVYLAYDPELDRRVAVKLVTAEGSGEAAATTRLLREAQALAQLSHPNVVAVHDVGRVGDGIYVAMEYVEGSTLGAWLREKQRSLPEILAVFAAAGRGIAAAHEAGLVHRDIKPDNIMVGRDGRVRVLDFGLARVSGVRLGTGDGEPSRGGTLGGSDLDLELTAVGTIMGTPVYMAPEQYSGQPADARSDIYSLSVALWEAVHGRRPFAGDSLPELADNVLAGRIVEATNPRVPGWLQVLLRRGFARAPDDRFVAMRELVAELEHDRHRRRRGLAFAGGLVLAATLGVAIARGGADDELGCGAFDRTLDGVWDDALRERIAATFAAEGKAYASTSRREVVRTLDAYADELVAAREQACEDARGRGTQSEHVMGLRMACLDGRSRQLGALAEALAEGGKGIVEHAVDAAQSLPRISDCEDADRLLREVPLPEDPATREEVAAVRGEIEAISAAISAGDFERLGVRIDDVVARARGIGYAPVVGEALLRRGVLNNAMGDADTAAAALEEALTLAEVHGHDELVVAASTELLVVESRLRGRFDVADVHVRHAMAVLERMGEPGDARLQLLVQVGQLENIRHDYAAALTALGEAATIARNLGRERDPAVSMVRNAMVIALIESDRLDEADQMIDANLELLEGSVGASHPNTGAALAIRARLRNAQGRAAESVELWQRAREVFIGAYGHDHSNVGAAYNGEGLALVRLGRDAEAVGAFEQSLGVSERRLGRDHLHVAIALANLAGAQTRLGRADEAVANLHRAIEIRAAKLGPAAEPTASAQDLLGDALLAAGDPVGAAASYRRAISSFEKLGGSEDSRASYGWHGLGRIAEQAGDITEATRCFERALALLASDTPQFDRGDVLFGLARVLADSAPDRARTLREQARAAYVAAGPRSALQVAALDGYERAQRG